MKFSLKKKSEEGEAGANVVSTPTKASTKAAKTADSPASTADGSFDSSPTKSRFSSLFKMTSKNKDAAATASPVSSASSDDIPVAGLEIRVGRITNVTEHEKEKHEKVYCMDIDIGDKEGGPRQIAAGLRSVMSANELNGRTVLVLCNIKPKKLGNYYSHGAVLCAASDSTVKLIAVPVDAKVGERVIVPGFGGPFDEVMCEKEAEKLKVVEKVMPYFKTNQFGVPEICNRPLMTTAGVCTCAVRNTAVTQI